jgi:hypothetical protein
MDMKTEIEEPTVILVAELTGMLWRPSPYFTTLKIQFHSGLPLRYSYNTFTNESF